MHRAVHEHHPETVSEEAQLVEVPGYDSAHDP